jgi:hypothetical protein
MRYSDVSIWRCCRSGVGSDLREPLQHLEPNTAELVPSAAVEMAYPYQAPRRSWMLIRILAANSSGPIVDFSPHLRFDSVSHFFAIGIDGSLALSGLLCYRATLRDLQYVYTNQPFGPLSCAITAPILTPSALCKNCLHTSRAWSRTMCVRTHTAVTSG